jgi:hypothetical protein
VLVVVPNLRPGVVGKACCHGRSSGVAHHDIGRGPTRARGMRRSRRAGSSFAEESVVGECCAPSGLRLAADLDRIRAYAADLTATASGVDREGAKETRVL